jgi:hypothetical protein
MKAYINHQLLVQTRLDSAELTMLAVVVHNFPEPGEYHGAVMRGKQTEATFRLTVDEKSPAMQVDIDLATLNLPAPAECPCKEGEHDDTRHFVVNPRGQTVLYVSQGTGGFAVAVNKVNDRRILFDSRELREGDLFAATLIRPGTYSVANANARAEIVIAFPKQTKTAFRPPDPITIEVTDKGLMTGAAGKETKVTRIGLDAAQGQIYRIRTAARIQIELLKPDDGPGDEGGENIFKWKKPAGGTGQRRPPRSSEAKPAGAEESSATQKDGASSKKMAKKGS